MKIIDLEGETDASVWVEAWLRAVAVRPGILVDRNVMRGWFGSAIEAGRAAGSGVDAGLEEGVRRVMAAGLATGHANTWAALMDEVLDQYWEMRERAVGVAPWA